MNYNSRLPASHDPRPYNKHQAVTKMTNPNKVYVGKLPPGEALSKEDLQEHFSQYGEVAEVEWKLNKFRKEKYNFAFITFSSQSAVQNLIKQKSSTVKNFQLEIKPAILQEKKPPRPYLQNKRKIAPPSSSTKKKSKARAEKYYEMNNTLKSTVILGQSYRCNLVRMERPDQVWLREEGRTEDYYKMKNSIQSYFLSQELEPAQVMKSGSIVSFKTADSGWARARVLSTNKDRLSLLL